MLVNNAGSAWGASFGEVPELGWDKVMDLNAKTTFFLSQALLEPLSASATHEDPARIINIGSVDGLSIPKLETYSYPASKAAVHHLTRVLAHHLGKKNITVNAIAPGPFESKMMDYTLTNHRDEIERILPRNPRRHCGHGNLSFVPSRSILNWSTNPCRWRLTSI
jgi:NAD(P)-dependent dehydrogenase (short-subunit alcohol dehydrogenase family)